MLKVGDKAPIQIGTDQNGNEHTLTMYLGKKVIIYFYPKDSTPGCTQQACNLRDGYNELQKAGYVLFGVSMDNAKSHARFIEKNELPFPLIVDEQRNLINAYGVWGPKKFMGREYEGILRTTFVIDEQGTIVQVIDKPKVKEHTQQILNQE
jgi:peroxiredoxin Q/BCP